MPIDSQTLKTYKYMPGFKAFNWKWEQLIKIGKIKMAHAASFSASTSQENRKKKLSKKKISLSPVQEKIKMAVIASFSVAHENGQCQ